MVSRSPNAGAYKHLFNDISTVQQPLGHKDVKTTMVCTQRAEPGRARSSQSAGPDAGGPFNGQPGYYADRPGPRNIPGASCRVE